MKTTLLAALAAVTAITFASCDNNKANNVPNNGNNKQELYTGIIPAADVQATAVTVMLDFDDDHNYTDGDFVMVENSLASDTLDASGLKAVASSYSEGDFVKESRVVEGNTVEYIKLVPDAKDILGAASTAPTFLLVNADGSLTVVGADLQPSQTPGLNYTLTRR